MERSWPLHSTRPSRLALASKWFLASTNGMPVSLRRYFGDLRAELRMGVDAGADRGAAGRQFENGIERLQGPVRGDSSSCRAKPLNSWPSRIGVASARCVRPILMMSSHSFALSASTSWKRSRAGTNSLRWPGRRRRGWRWGTCRWSTAPC